MNLAVRDLRQHWGRFGLSCLGVGLLLALVLSFAGIYNGFVADALGLIRSSGADLWVVQKDTRGPFAEMSRLPDDVRYRIAVVPGVRETSPYIFYTVQRPWHGRLLRFVVVGYDLGTGMGGPSQLVAGRGIAQAHYEMVADQKLGLRVGDVVHLGLHDYTVVGLTRGMVGSGGDPVAFFSYQDAEEIQFVKDNWAIRNARQRALAAYTHALPTQPTLAAGLARSFSDNPELHNVNAILVHLAPGADPAAVAAAINRWEYFTAYTAADRIVPSVAYHRHDGDCRPDHLHDDVGEVEADCAAQTHRRAQPPHHGSGASTIVGAGANRLRDRAGGWQPDLRQMATPGAGWPAGSTVVAGHRGGHLSGGQRDGVAARAAGGSRRSADGVMPWKSSTSRI
jgi:hypothetical protein